MSYREERTSMNLPAPSQASAPPRPTAIHRTADSPPHCASARLTRSTYPRRRQLASQGPSHPVEHVNPLVDSTSAYRAYLDLPEGALRASYKV